MLIDSKVNKLDKQYPRYLADFENFLVDSLQDLLGVNAQITGFCSDPDAVIYIPTGDHPPVSKRQYRVPHSLQEVVDKQLAKWLANRVVTELEGTTAWNNPLLVVPKRDVAGNIKDYRVCIDPRPLNLMFESVNFPLPIIKEIFEALYGSKVFTRIDLKSAFSQFMIYLKDRYKTTFTWRGTQYHFVGAPFGFKHVHQYSKRS